MTKQQKIILAIMFMMTTFILIIPLLLAETRDASLVVTVTPVATSVMTQNNFPHKLAAIMHDPFESLSSKNMRKIGLLIVVDAWKNFSASDARTLVDYYEAVYSDSDALVIDFLCDDKYATEASYLAASDAEFYPHVLFNYTRSPKTVNGTWIVPPALYTSKDYPSYGTACK